MKSEQTFVNQGILFTVSEEDDGKFVADIAIGPTQGLALAQIEDWARVVGRFDSMGDAITAAKDEIEALASRDRPVR